jgi:glutamate 5-kinase
MSKRKRGVAKIGTKAVTLPDGTINVPLLDSIAQDIQVARAEGWDVALVSSGAVACGKNDGKMKAIETTDQVFAMVGQRHLLNNWAEAFAKVGLVIGQGLYTNRMLGSLPERKKIIRDGLLECFRVGLVPVLNENDAAVLDELMEVRKEGDNDHLASLVGCLLDAEALVYLTTAPGVIDPASGNLMARLDARDKELLASIVSWPGQSKGGMHSKVEWGQNYSLATGGKAYIKQFDGMLAISRALRGMNEGTVIETM